MPAEAETILSRMTGNRKQRRGHAEIMAADMREGRWVETHEPIAMSVDGNLIDGQHRLAAVVLSGVGQWFWVAVYDTHQTAIGLPIDCGVRRNTSDLLGLDRKFAEVASAIYRYGIAWHREPVRPAHVEYIARACSAQISAVLECSRGNKRTKASATARAAIAINAIIYPDDTDDIFDEYLLWTSCENATWQSVLALNKQLQVVKKYKPEDLFVRIAKAFSPPQKTKTMLRVNERESRSLRDEIRERMIAILFPEGKP